MVVAINPPADIPIAAFINMLHKKLFSAQTGNRLYIYYTQIPRQCLHSSNSSLGSKNPPDDRGRRPPNIANSRGYVVIPSHLLERYLLYPGYVGCEVLFRHHPGCKVVFIYSAIVRLGPILKILVRKVHNGSVST